MSRALKTLVATALLAVGLLALTAGGASADPSHSASCAFTGLAGTAHPFGAGTGVQSVQTDIANGGPTTVATDTDSGSYDFSGSATCVINDGSGTSNPASATIASHGTYTNNICGTGTADAPGTPAQADTTVSVGSTVAFNSVRYNIQFASGQGALMISNAHDNATGENMTGGGAVQIAPDVAHNGGNCGTQDVTQFTVDGSFAVHG